MSNMFNSTGVERVIPFALFALYLLTAVRICRYSSWIKAGAPNPFLPRQIKRRVNEHDIKTMLAAEISAFA